LAGTDQLRLAFTRGADSAGRPGQHPDPARKLDAAVSRPATHPLTCRPIVRVEALINNTLPYPLASYGLERPDIAVTFGPAANHMRFDD